MVDRAERDPTMEEIVVALRETRRAAGRALPFAVIGGRYDDNQAPLAATDGRIAAAGGTDVAGLRDSEIQRLLHENAQLNQRVVALLKVIEHEQARGAASPANGHDREAIVRDVTAALESQLRPVLDILLRLLERFRAAPGGRAPTQPAAPLNDGVIDLDAPRAHEQSLAHSDQETLQWPPQPRRNTP
jgi:hypothetical protein